MNEFFEDQDGIKITKGLDEAVILCGRVIRYQVNTQCLSSTQQVQLNRGKLPNFSVNLCIVDRSYMIFPKVSENASRPFM